MWPYHGCLDPARTALVACVDRKWRAPVPDSDERDSRLGQIAGAVRASGGFVVALTATTGPPVGRRPALRVFQETALPDTVLAVLDPDAALECDGLAVPGVGAFAACMSGLRAVGGDKLIARRIELGRPVLGICVGMQVLFAASAEAPGGSGGVVPPGQHSAPGGSGGSPPGRYRIVADLN